VEKNFDKCGLGQQIFGPLDGVVAQLVEHHNGIVGVRGSNPLGSTILCSKDLREKNTCPNKGNWGPILTDFLTGMLSGCENRRISPKIKATKVHQGR
jgi:hypothetical protein